MIDEIGTGHWDTPRHDWLQMAGMYGSDSSSNEDMITNTESGFTWSVGFDIPFGGRNMGF